MSGCITFLKVDILYRIWAPRYVVFIVYDIIYCIWVGGIVVVGVGFINRGVGNRDLVVLNTLGILNDIVGILSRA